MHRDDEESGPESLMNIDSLQMERPLSLPGQILRPDESGLRMTLKPAVFQRAARCSHAPPVVRYRHRPYVQEVWKYRV